MLNSAVIFRMTHERTARGSAGDIPRLSRQSFMKRKYTLKENHLFTRAYKKGKSVAAYNAVVYVMYNRDQKADTKIGITVSTKNGNAVRRNRAKRIIREAARLLYPTLKKGLFIVIVARKPAYIPTHKMQQVKRTLEKAFKDLKIVNLNQ